MSKRFTETTKWDDPWYHDLPPEAKLLWLWLTDKCDQSGVVDVSYSIASFQIGMKVEEDTLKALGTRMTRLPSGKWRVAKFLEFQYGTLSETCPAHKPVFRALKANGIQYPIGRVSDTLQEEEEDKEEEKKGIGGAGGKGLNSAEWTERILDAYVSKTHRAGALQCVVASLLKGAEPEVVLQGTRECAAAIRKKEQAIGGRYGFTPNPEKFFEQELWSDAALFISKIEASRNGSAPPLRPGSMKDKDGTVWTTT